MATAKPVPRFAPADLVKYQGEGEYMVLSVNNVLGFNKFQLINIRNGQQVQASSHELQKIRDDILKAEEDEESEVFEGNETVVPKARFTTLNAEELDNLAKKRTEPGTDKQTKWAIKIFKGKDHHFVNKPRVQVTR